MDPQPKKKFKTVAQKLEIIRALETGQLQKDVCKQFNVKQSTVATIFKNKEELKRRAQDSPGLLKLKKSRVCKFPTVDKAVELFIAQAREHNVPLSGPIIQAKAKLYAVALGIDGFEASSGWLTKFTARHGISFKSICGESKAVDLESANDWIENILPGLLEGYGPNDIYNADETGFFFKCLPGKFFFRSM
jgi:Tc5 transposase DNA-binding domain/CENP-B N-terminal DNA-binding domain